MSSTLYLISTKFISRTSQLELAKKQLSHACLYLWYVQLVPFSHPQKASKILTRRYVEEHPSSGLDVTFIVNNSANWTSEFMTSIVTWQVRLTLDSIHNVCDMACLGDFEVQNCWNDPTFVWLWIQWNMDFSGQDSFPSFSTYENISRCLNWDLRKRWNFCSSLNLNLDFLTSWLSIIFHKIENIDFFLYSCTERYIFM